MKAKLALGFVGLVLVLGESLAPSPAEAASVKSVQSGTVAMSTNTQTATITAVDTTKSFVVCKNRTGTSNASNRATCELSSTAVTVKTGAANSAEVVQWHVVEFEGGVSVQRGSRNFSSGVATFNEGLTAAVDLSKSFVLISEKTSSASQIDDEAWTIRAELTTSTNLALTRNDSAITVDVAWQVVQMEGASVQRGLTTIGAGSGSATAAISSVNTATSFLVMSRRGNSLTGGVDGQYQVRGELTGPTTVTFTRVNTTNTVDIAWEVVSLGDGTTVQSGATDTGGVTSASTLNAPIPSAIDTSRTVPFISVRGGGTSTANLDETSWTATFTTTTNLQLQRVGTGTNAFIAWFAVQFFQCAAVAEAGYVAANATNGQAILYWSSANPVVILEKSGTAFLASEKPDNGKGYAAGASGGELGGATVVYDGAATVAGMSCSGTSCTRTGLTNGMNYYYKVLAKTGSGGGSCYAPGTVNTTAGVNALPDTGADKPAWSYALAGGSILKGGTAGTGTLYATSNASRIVSLNTADGTQSWAPVATNAPVQAWLTWLPVGTGGGVTVQTGIATMPAGGAAAPQTVNIGAAQGFAGVSDLTKSVLFFSMKVSSNDGPGDGQVRGQLTSTTNIRFYRADDTSLTDVTIRWYVVEFTSGVFVQRGTNASTTNVTLGTAVTLSQSFTLISCSAQTGNTTYDTNDYHRARLIDSSTLELYHNGTANEMDCDWQVVQYTNASVQRNTGTLASGALTSGPIAISSVDTTKSFVHVTWFTDAATTATGANFLRARLTSATTIEIDRAFVGSTLNYAWEVVSFTDGTTVRNGTAAFGSGSIGPQTGALSPAVNTARSVAFTTAYQRGGQHALSTDDNVGPGWFTVTITDSTTVTLERAITGSVAADAGWVVVEFAGAGGSSPAVIGVDQGTGVADSGRLYSVDPASGTTNWQQTLTGADAFQAGVASQIRTWSGAAFQAAYADDVIFAATLNTLGTFTTNNKVFARSLSDGALLWTFTGTMDGIVGMPYVDYALDRLYVTSRAGSGGGQQSLWVIKTVDGEGVLKGQAMACPACTGLGHLETSPTLSYDGLTLWVGSTAGTLHAINTTNLTLKWSLALGSAVTGFVWEEIVGSGRLYFATADGTVRCIQDTGASGTPCAGWTSPSVSGVPSTPLLLGGKLFVGSYDSGAAVGQKGKLYQVNTTTGAVEKSIVVGDGEKQVGDASTETGSEVFVGTDQGKIFKFPLTGGSL